MRYLIQKEFQNEVGLRKDYIWDALKLWVITQHLNQNFIELKSMPFNAIDVCFIVAHNLGVISLLDYYNIDEKYIVIISCTRHLDSSLKVLKNKNIYICKQNEESQAVLYKGKEFGFDFDLTESEILFFNSSINKPIIERLDEAFTKL